MGAQLCALARNGSPCSRGDEPLWARSARFGPDMGPDRCQDGAGGARGPGHAPGSPYWLLSVQSGSPNSVMGSKVASQLRRAPPPRQEGARDTGRAHTHTEAQGKRYSSSQCGRRARAHTRGGSCRCRRSSSLARQTLGSTAAARRQTARQAQTDAQARGAGRARAYRGELPVRAAAAPAPRCPASRRAAPCARTHTHTPKRLVSLAVPEPNAPAFARMPPRAALARRLRRTRRRAQGVCGRATIVGGSDQNTRGPVYVLYGFFTPVPPRTLVPWKDTASPAAAEFCSQAAMRARRSAAAWPRGRE